MSDATGWMPPRRKHDLTECRAFLRAVLAGKDRPFAPYRHKRGRLITTWHPTRVEECKQDILATAITVAERGIKVTDRDVLRIVYGIFKPADNAIGWWLYSEWTEQRMLVSNWIEPAALPAPAGHVLTPLDDLPLFGRGALTLAESAALGLLGGDCEVFEISDSDILSEEVIGAPCTALAIFGEAA